MVTEFPMEARPELYVDAGGAEALGIPGTIVV
jgi:hypothetical protein